ncbi:MAG: hypothetical protein IIW21_04680 [Clostridia bacterium]|nr:hypothetical protein [Clostridia bacterium]
MTDTDKRLLSIQRSIEELYDNQVRQRRMLSDLLYNLDWDNMPAVKEMIERYKSENGEAIASIRMSADENYAAIESLAAVQTEQGISLAAITQTATELGAEVVIAAEAASEANGKVSNGAYIIARVNEDGSGVKISADKVAIEGFVTFESLQAPGETTINGANIETGTLAADKIAVGPNGQIDFGRLGSLEFLTPDGASGEIRLNENEYGRGEISVRADMYVGISAGSANFILNELPNGDTEARIYAGELVINGNRGLTGTYSLGGGSVTVQNGIVVNVVEGSGGGSDAPTSLMAPYVSVNGESASFSIDNPNGKGKICYQEAYYDSNGSTWTSSVKTSTASSVSSYFSKLPPYGGELEISAWVEWDGHASPTASASDTMA